MTFQKVLNFERSKNKTKMARTKVVLDQLYQLMVFETPSFQEEVSSVKILDVHLKIKNNKHKNTRYISYERAFNLLQNDP